MSCRIAIHVPAVIALPILLLLAALLLAALFLVAGKDAILERVETAREDAALEGTEGGEEGARDVGVVNDDARDGTLLIATFALEPAGAEYQLFMAELL